MRRKNTQETKRQQKKKYCWPSSLATDGLTKEIREGERQKRDWWSEQHRQAEWEGKVGVKRPSAITGILQATLYDAVCVCGWVNQYLTVSACVHVGISHANNRALAHVWQRFNERLTKNTYNMFGLYYRSDRYGDTKPHLNPPKVLLKAFKGL